MKRYSYDINKYDFVSEIESLYDINDLDEIHNQWGDAKVYDVLDDVATDQLTVYHRKFYNESKNTNFYDVYKSFISEFIQPIFGEEILYQRIPTFRVHQPNNLAVAEYHRDSDYSHSKSEVNFFLPLTKAWGNNTIWTETERDKKDFQPIEAEVGDVWLWNGSVLLHGNKLNDTGKSRVSVDFRVLPLSKYKESDKVSITNKTKMVIGDYWTK
tara:strand:+ start:990 stop:1628 length:639 start_codon:yes stop_codon:yes gene_type:complete